MINTPNEIKCPLLRKFWIYNFSQRILERVFVGSIVNIRFAVHVVCLSRVPIHSPWTYILNNISYGSNILLMTVEVNGSRSTIFHSNSFEIDHTMPSFKANDYVTFQTLTMSWNLNMGYKKIITLTHKRSTIASNTEKKMIESMEQRYFINTCLSGLKC